MRTEVENKLLLPEGSLKSSRDDIMAMVEDVIKQIETENNDNNDVYHNDDDDGEGGRINTTEEQHDETPLDDDGEDDNDDDAQSGKGVVRKRGKYSDKEVKAVMDVVFSFMAAQGITKEELCPTLRVEGGEKKKKRNSSLWSDLSVSFPNRLRFKMMRVCL